jgi:hypothetical protein
MPEECSGLIDSVLPQKRFVTSKPSHPEPPALGKGVTPRPGPP